jgi:type IV pilus assembly protein PilN
MIKINLLPARKPKRQADPASQPLMIGVVAIVAAAAAVLLLVDRPRRSELAHLQKDNADLQNEINAKREKLKGYPELLAAEAEAEKRVQSIVRLQQAKVVPAHVMQELGEILTEHHLPTMSEDMTKKTGGGPESDPNKRFQLDWDPTHVWLTSFIDTGGAFRMEGGAVAESDVTQLSKRLAASVYFMEVTPSGGQRVADAASGLQYYKFQISGKVAY